ncbi:MAG: hypothetical protein Q8880_02055 [Bacteroidota bacterium]|nr:hypothetical protein [Bacteroidota bacterium]
MISDTLGVYETDGIIQYLVNGLPVNCHDKGDIIGYWMSEIKRISNLPTVEVPGSVRNVKF